MGKKRKRIRWSLLIWVVVVAVGASYAVQRQLQSGRGTGIPKGGQVAAAVRGAIQERITATGVVAAQTGAMVKIGSQITGRIRRLPADVGTQIQAGQVVAVLDSPDLQAQVDQQRHSVAAAEASLAQARSRLHQAIENSGFSKQQTDAQIAEADAALKAAAGKVESSAATAQLQPTQTATGITSAAAALSTAQSQQQQVEQTARQQILQAQSSVDDAQAAADNAQRTLARQEKLLAQGFIPAQNVDDSRASARQMVARLESAKANLDIVKEKTRADLLAARDQVSQAKANLASARASRLQDTMRAADLRTARESLRQAQATLALQRASRSQDRMRQMAIIESQGAVEQAQEALLQARAQLRYQLAQWDKTVIHSPIRGTVLSITAQQGETIAAGLAAPTLITVADLNRLEVLAYVDETDIGRVRLGLPAEVRVEAFPARTFHGRVTRIASASTIKDNVVTYETTIALRDAVGLPRPDMTADVTLILGEQKDVVLVPSEAVHREINRSIVYVLHRKKQGKERAEIRAVKPGIDDGLHAELRSGLQPGEEVVLAGLPRLGVQAADAQSGGPGRR